MIYVVRRRLVYITKLLIVLASHATTMSTLCIFIARIPIYILPFICYFFFFLILLNSILLVFVQICILVASAHIHLSLGCGTHTNRF